MRRQMMQSVMNILEKNNNTSLFLVDIGVWGFREALQKFPDRAINVGIFEDGMIGIAAGMALSGFIPFIYGISPFLIGRPYEQLKLDFCYQKLGGNLIGTGAAYDFSTLGYSHYCQEDVDLISSLPGMELVAPGTPEELKTLLEATWNNGNLTYFRLSDFCNNLPLNVRFPKATIVKRGSKATVLAVSTTLDAVLAACEDEDVTILYYTTLLPFDTETLRMNLESCKLLVCEPHYKAALAERIYPALTGFSCQVEFWGMQRTILRTYGTKQEKDEMIGLTARRVKEKLRRLFQ